jgi:phosphate transport system protein
MSTPGYKSHISSAFNAELEDVRQRVLAMGGLVEQQIIDATRALMDLDGDLADQVRANDDKVDQLELLIDDECSRILARRQPTASDLRLVYAVIKTITDLERIGDEAHKIAQMARDLSRQERLATNMKETQHLSRQVSRMVRSALDAFARMDAEAAVATVREDVDIDREYEALMRQCITYMMEEPRSIRRVIDLIWCVRALERIGDHAKNIAEYVIYFVKGKDVRHTSIEQIEREVLGGGQ